MGHRANLVIVDHDGWRLHYSHWAANGIYRWLAAGPDPAMAFVLAQRQVDVRHGWLNDVWCEGGTVVDTVARRLLWFGNDVMSDLPERRAYSRLLSETWPGWRVDWAYDGVGDLAAHVGIDRAAVRALDMKELTAAPRIALEINAPRARDNVEPPPNRQEWYDLLTVRTADGGSAWALTHQLHGHPAWLGPPLLDQLPGPGFDRLRLAALPCAGLHIDVPAREVGIWVSGICPGLLPALDEQWPGWSVTFWHDRYERQLAAAEHAVTVPACDEGRALDRLAKFLLPGSAESAERTSPPASLIELVERYHAAGKQVDVNAAAWHHVETLPSRADLRRIAEAITKVAADLGGRPFVTGT